MKRRISKTTVEDPQRGIRGARGSDSQFRIPTSRRTQDINSRKRVKFTDLDVDDPLSCRPNASSTPLQGSWTARSDDAKTSEYAFFKKLKEDVGHKFHSHSLHKEDNQSKKVKSIDRSGELRPREACTTSGSICNIQENMKEYGNALNLGGAEYRHEEIFFRKREKLRQWVTETSYPDIEELCSKGYDFVSVLLSRLFPENNENSGFKDLVSGEVDIDTKSQFLASSESDIQLKKSSHKPARNFMELDHESYLDDGSSSRWLNRLEEMVISDSYSPTSDANIARVQYEARETGYGLGGRNPVSCTESDSAYGFPFKRYGSLALGQLKELDEFHVPNEYLLGKEPHTLLLGWDFDRCTDERNLSIASQSTELSMHSPSSSSWGDYHQQSLDDSFGREPHTLLLGWDFDRSTDERKLSITCQSAELTVHSPSSSSQGDYHQRSLDDSFGMNDLNKSSLLSIYSPNKFSLPWLHSASSCDYEFGRHVDLDKEDIDADFNRFPLTLSHAPDFLNLAAVCNNDTKCKDSSIFLPPQNHQHFMSKAFSERFNHHPDVEGFLLSSELGFDLEWNCSLITGSSKKRRSSFNCALQSPRNDEDTSSHFLLKDKDESCLDGSSHRGTLSHFSEDIVNIQECSSFYFHIPLDKDKACPLLLDKSSWDGTQEQMYSDHNEVNYI